MFKYNFISTLRHLIKRPFFLIINVTGLTLGVLISSLLALYVNNELSVDNGLAKSEDIYRLVRLSSRNGDNYRIGVTSGPFAEALLTDYPQDVEATLRIYPDRGLVTVDKENYHNVSRLYQADSNFFDFFNYEFLVGNEATAFKQANSVVISEEHAKILFANSDPLGHIIIVDNELQFTVTGVVKNQDFKSHINFDIIVTNESQKSSEYFKRWWSNGLVTYVKMNPSTNIDEFQSTLPSFMDKYFGDDFRESGLRTDLGLQHITDIYFGNDVHYDRFVHGNKKTVFIFTVIGIFIMVIACINFVNISTALASTRSKEVGIKKIMGSGKSQLMLQYLTESLMICSISVILAFMLLEIILPYFNGAYNLDLTIKWFEPKIATFGISLIIVLVLLSGIYPSLLLSSFHPLKVLTGKGSSGNSVSSWVRKGLVVFQFSCSILLLIATTIIWRQMNFIMNKPLGFDKSHIIMVGNDNSDIRSNLDLFVERTEQIPGVESVTKIVGEPTGFHDTMNFKQEGNEETVRIRTTFSDAAYLDCFNIPMATGRFFRKDNPLDREKAMVLNETAVKNLGFTNESVLGLKLKNLYVDSTFREVIGVVKDYNFISLKDDMEPLAIAPSSYYRKVAIKLDANNVKQAIDDIQKTYEGIVNLYPFEYEFLDDNIGDLYAEEQTQQAIFMMFSIISIIIGCLGIFGLATFTANQRAREISIRKVLGASVANISYMLGNQFVKLVLISNLVAWPLAYYVMSEWLNEFAYRISIGLDSFILAMLLALSIAIITVSYQSIKAALVNPANTLRNE